MGVLLRQSETTIIMQHLWKMECNSGDSSCGRFSEPLPFGMSLCIWSPTCLLGAADFECFMYAEHASSASYRDVRCVRVSTCTKRVVNLRISCLLCPIFLMVMRQVFHLIPSQLKLMKNLVQRAPVILKVFQRHWSQSWEKAQKCLHI